MVFDLRDRRKRYLHDLAICDLHLYAGSGEGLGGFHAPNCASDAPAVGRDNLHIVLAIKWLQSRECFGDFHDSILPEAVLKLSQILPFMGQEVYPRQLMQPENIIWRIESCPCILG